MREIIGIVGKKRAGKDSIAGYLCEQGFIQYAFADELKDIAYDLAPVIGGQQLSSIVDLIGWETAKEMSKVRVFLQELGVTLRHADPDYWVRQVTQYLRPDGKYVISDVRFENEAKAIVALGGKLIHVIRPDAEEGDAHESENFDWLSSYERDTIWNKDTLERLFESVEVVLANFRREWTNE